MLSPKQVSPSWSEMQAEGQENVGADHLSEE